MMANRTKVLVLRALKITALGSVLAASYLLWLPQEGHIILAVVASWLALEGCLRLFEFRQAHDPRGMWFPSRSVSWIERAWIGLSEPVYRLVYALVAVSVAVSEILAALSQIGAPQLRPHEYALLFAGADAVLGTYLPANYTTFPKPAAAILTIFNTFIVSGGIFSVLTSWWRFSTDANYRAFVLGYEDGHAHEAVYPDEDE
jgi:hypothetical protein